MLPIAVMQGRLSPPVAGTIQAFPRFTWAAEFARAAAAGLAAIEWIDDSYGLGVNPIASDAGIAEIHALARQHAVAVHSLCADYFMERPLLRSATSEVADRLARLAWLIERCHCLGVQRIVLPFVDNSRIATPAEAEQVVAALHHLLPIAERVAIELHLETDLDPERFRALLARLPHPLLRVNYDTGNSAALGFCPRDEFAAYGERIGSVHIKDRRRGGGTLPLGTGDADLPAAFAGLRALGYRGDLVLQVARDEAGDEVAWARANCRLVERLWVEAADGLAAA